MRFSWLLFFCLKFTVENSVICFSKAHFVLYIVGNSSIFAFSITHLNNDGDRIRRALCIRYRRPTSLEILNSETFDHFTLFSKYKQRAKAKFAS
jgi:hypothetical protein